ncbi:hypothetical protein F441_17758 [Phytophthora nicotianae CJ01A1]|uniref:Fe2OG dioxygenase domain-containing protein n=1 Tax=Phytophthora nicotianae CJ01A1 TaxID=1317063 RepID=W2W551_PHYNI|nr:hypothetical protein F441_17758 [Phytophthora nicotianae CJ01A1]
MVSIEEDFEEGQWPFGGDGDFDEVPVPVGASCVKISEILASADEKAGEYSFGGIADSLPSAPGLFIDDVGAISLPLVPEQAEKLISKCEKSPFGHNMETKTDENVRKSWQLAPRKVKLKNSQWTSGIKELTATISQRLGYENVQLDCVLYKLLVYGEGGHFVKHQDTEKEDGMIATLVVQPPSTHDGGDLVVFRGGKERYRHDFGKIDGTAPYFTHYAVHYADAEHALEEVTKGYRLVMVYSICLPKTMRHLKKDSNMPMSDDLADAISEMELNHESFALRLSHEYTKKSIKKMGSGALKGVDSARFRALEEANAVVPADKKMRIFIAKLSHKIISILGLALVGGWQEVERSQTIHWYSVSGKDLGSSKDKDLTTSATNLNFLNPGQDTYTQLWEAYGTSKEEPYTGNEGPTRNTKYSRYAIVAWPASQHTENALKHMSLELGVEALMEKRPADKATLRNVLQIADSRLNCENWSGSKASVRFCRSFCELLLDIDDVELVKLFFSKFCPRLGELYENTTLIPVLIKIVSTFGWGEIGDTLLAILGNVTSVYQEDNFGVTHLEMTLQVLDGLEEGPGKQALLKLAVDLAVKIDQGESDMNCSELDLNSPSVIDILWKNIIQSTAIEPFETMANHLMSKDPSELGQAIQAFSQYVGELDETSDKFVALASIGAKRAKWLKREIRLLDKPFSFEMPDANFPDNKTIEDFLRGPGTSMKTEGLIAFSGLPDARKYAATCVRKKQDGATFTMKPAGKGKKAFVTITKTRKWFNRCQDKLVQYRAELDDLEKLYDHTATGSQKKKCRRE